MVEQDEYFMGLALEQAAQAFEQGEVPVGAIIVCNHRVIAKAHNLTETLNDATAHAEMLALTSAANYLGNRHLSACTLYVTVEPCPMCAGALFWAQIGRVVYGAPDDKRGFRRFSHELLHPKTNLTSNVLTEECQHLMKDFFKSLRK